MSRRRIALALGGSLVLLGCASGGAVVAATKPLPVIQVSDHRDGGNVTLRRGQKLRVVLHSTYWEFTTLSQPSVLRLVGEPQVSPKTSGCVPGQGCGTVTATYIAKARGSAVVAAARTSCGEAMGCTAAAAGYKLTVTVLRSAR